MLTTLARVPIPDQRRRVTPFQNGVCAALAPRVQRRRRTSWVEVLTPPVSRGPWIETLAGIDEMLRDTQYARVVRPIQHTEQRDRLLQTSPHLKMTDGVLVLSLRPSSDLLEWLRRVGMPAVLIDAEHPSVSSVVVDHEAAARVAVQHLVALGHQRVALVDHLCDGLASDSGANARQRGYRAALIAADIAPRQAHECLTECSPDAARTVLEDWLTLPDPPTAVFAGSDRQALGVLEGARLHGRRVPEDLAVVGYYDSGIARALDLTTVHVPLRMMGQRAAGLLLDALEGPYTEPVRVRLQSELVIRQTCGAR